MGKRGQILADELLASCKRYIRFRETGSPDPVEAGGEICRCGHSMVGYHRTPGTECASEWCRCFFFVASSEPPPPAGRAGEREEGLERLKDQVTEWLATSSADCDHFCGCGHEERIENALAALAPSEGEDITPDERGHHRAIVDVAVIDELKRELAEARAAIRTAAIHTTWPAINKRNVWLALPAVQAARNPST